MRRFLEMIRFSHTLFALPFALFSAILAWYEKRDFAGFWIELTGILLCMVFARSAAMAFNRLVDRDIRRLESAHRRPTSSERPTQRRGGLAVHPFLQHGFIASTALFLLANNPWPFYLSLPVLLFVAGVFHHEAVYGSRRTSGLASRCCWRPWPPGLPSSASSNGT